MVKLIIESIFRFNVQFYTIIYLGGQNLLSNIIMKNVASYNEEGTCFQNLRKVNLIYGNNGSGKSTLSNFFNDIESFDDCTYEGKMSDEKLIYNKNFIEENFKSDNEIPGIFTLGKDHVETQTELEETEKIIERNSTARDKASDELTDTEGDLKTLQEEFADLIWNKKNDRHIDINFVYQHSFKGLHGSKNKFYQEYINQKHLNNQTLLDEEDLLRQAKVVFAEQQTEIPLIEVQKFEVKWDNEVLKKSIIGQEDIDFAELVNELNIHTWVHEGFIKVKDHNLKNCPFCRSEFEENFLTSLQEYFNAKFEDELIEMKRNIDIYKGYAENVISYLGNLLKLENDYLNKQEVENIFHKINAKNEENLRQLSEKEREPIKKVNLNTLEDDMNILFSLLESNNTDISAYNQTLNQLGQEREKIIKICWRHFLHLTGEEFKRFEKTEKQLASKIQGLSKSITRYTEYVLENQRKYDEIKENMFGVSSTVTAINQQLNLYGFKNFLLNATEEDGKYRIVRETGESANKTLSEGEKPFITFLYYYHLVKNETNKKLVFIDDPISSLDSTVLYIVSTLVQDLISNTETYNIDQIFVSTHNTYFFKEITYKIENCSFYVIRKDRENGSYTTRYEKNPISSSYESLWRELVELKDSNSNIIQNIMRRILENYFKFLGGIDLEDLTKNFEEDERIIVSSLIKWTHDGSHHVQEDLYIQQYSEMNQKYYEVFSKIFIRSKHQEHLYMMIDKCVEDETTNPFFIPSEQ